MRIRSIKPDYWQHEMHGEISPEASILGAALYNFSDDQGRFKVQFPAMRALLFTFRKITEERVAEAFEELVKWHHVATYKAFVEGREMVLGVMVSFNQNINKPIKSTLPSPPLESYHPQEGSTPVVLQESSPPQEGSTPVGLPGEGRKEGEERKEGGTRAPAREALTPSSTFLAPDLDQVKEYAGMRGIPPDCAAKYFYECEKMGWADRNGRMIVKWQAGLQSYAISWRSNDFLKNGGNKNAVAADDGALAQLEAELAGETDPEKRRGIREKIKKNRAALERG